MTRPPRLPLVLAFLIGVFVAATGLAAAVLATFRDPLLVTAAVVAGLACLVAVVISLLMLRSLQQDASGLPAVEETRLAPPPARIHALPEAELPPAYLDAVMRGIAANRAAMRARELRH